MNAADHPVEPEAWNCGPLSTIDPMHDTPAGSEARGRILPQSALARWIVQTVVGAFPTPAASANCFTFMNQIATLPLVSCQIMSLLPSPSKSPAPMIFHRLGDAFPMPADCMTCAPFISQIAMSPVVGSCHKMSPKPSPLKSPV